MPIRQVVKFPVVRGPLAAPAAMWDMSFTTVVADRPFDLAKDGAVAVVCVYGPLTQFPGALCDNYESILCRVMAACGSDAKHIVLRIDSPGGDFTGSLELSRNIAAMVKAAGKTLTAFTEANALSAAYALACSAREIVITPSAFIGSVGVWAPLLDVTAQDKAMGVNYAIVMSGAQKADRNPHVALTETTVDNLQTQINAMAALFFGWVSMSRSMSVDSIAALEGAQHFGADAVSRQLANRVVNSWSEFLATLGESKMGMYEEALAALHKAADEGSDEDKEKAKKALAKMSGGDDGDKDKDKKEAKAAADDEADKKEASAKAADEEKKDKEAKAAASASFNLAARVHALESQLAAKDEATKRQALLDKRPDFSAEVRATLQNVPLAMVKEACEKWAPMAAKTSPAAAATFPGGTVGSNQADAGASGLTKEHEQVLRGMGSGNQSYGIKNVQGGHGLELGFMSPDDARKALAAKKDGV